LDILQQINFNFQINKRNPEFKNLLLDSNCKNTVVSLRLSSYAILIHCRVTKRLMKFLILLALFGFIQAAAPEKLQIGVLHKVKGTTN
jgi:hypothetical protein